MSADQPAAAPTGPPEGPPVCPRHPDRVSYVRCQRCGRPTCPECQRQAAVGVQCVDCVAEAARAAPANRTVFGGTVRAGRPVVTIGIIAACVVSFLLQQVDPTWTLRWGFWPAGGELEPWRFLTVAFLHSPTGVIHIVFNMLALWMVGPFLEQALGRARFAALYGLSAVAGSVGVLLLASPLEDSWVTLTVGASGAVFGLFGAVFVVMRRMRRDVRSIAVVIGLNIVIGFVVPNIAWQAHLGGLVAGAALAAAFAYAPKERRGAVAVGATVLLGLLLVLLAVGKYALV
ncbi:rhomboid family intramembrane serine protease [Cellulomonas cellasea]|uniref:Protease n=2 Tax=Cellulomonas cellasea TaxID=43670 RepID=A0A0A0BCU0_9CELL|nr:rhomboid family intramembrane serine protease [Cellulomonas cellasea]KGM03166.1 protease [Cellulomonas cellasea DSM 20118]GEA87278.1 rhomboid family intramembrane serine protease [Cellulomonas cellasea]